MTTPRSLNISRNSGALNARVKRTKSIRTGMWVSALRVVCENQFDPKRVNNQIYTNGNVGIRMRSLDMDNVVIRSNTIRNNSGNAG